MIKGNLSLFVLSVFFLVSCDPTKSLTIKNKTGNDLTIRLKAKPNTEWIFSKSDSIDIPLAAKGHHSEVTYLGGFGVWTKTDLTEIQNSVYEIKIMSNSDTVSFKTKEELQQIIPKRRRGLLNNYLKIEIK